MSVPVRDILNCSILDALSHFAHSLRFNGRTTVPSYYNVDNQCQGRENMRKKLGSEFPRTADRMIRMLDAYRIDIVISHLYIVSDKRH